MFVLPARGSSIGTSATTRLILAGTGPSTQLLDGRKMLQLELGSKTMFDTWNSFDYLLNNLEVIHLAEPVCEHRP